MQASASFLLSLSLSRTHTHTHTLLQFLDEHFFLRATRCPRGKRRKACPETGSMPPPESLFFLVLLLSTSPLLCHSTSAYFLQIHFLFGSAARRCCCAQSTEACAEQSTLTEMEGSGWKTDPCGYSCWGERTDTPVSWCKKFRLPIKSREFRPVLFCGRERFPTGVNIIINYPPCGSLLYLY